MSGHDQGEPGQLSTAWFVLKLQSANKSVHDNNIYSYVQSSISQWMSETLVEKLFFRSLWSKEYRQKMSECTGKNLVNQNLKA